MKKQFLFLGACALLVLAIPSCSKDDADDVKPNVNVPDPNVPDPNVNDNGPKPPTPVFANVDGTLVSIMMSYTVENELLPMPMIMESELGVVAFMNGSTSNFFDAGTVKLNGYALEKAENHGYQVYATAGSTPSSLDIANGSSMWEVSGSSDVTGFTYNHQTPFPQFTGTLPTSISKSSDLTIQLDGMLSSADSVYLLVIASNEYVQTAVGGNASSITLTSSQLSVLPTVSDGSAFIEVVPFNIELENINGKNYAFVKEQAVVATVNIN